MYGNFITQANTFGHYLAKKNQNVPQSSSNKSSNSRPSVSDALNIIASKVPEFLGLKVRLPP